jgi:hypothetical protein
MSFVPNPMEHSSARLLEFELLRQLIAGYAASPLGKRRVEELRPSLDHAWIRNQHLLTTEIREYRRVGGRFEFAGLPEVQKLIEKSRIAGAAADTPVRLIAAIPLPARGQECPRYTLRHNEFCAQSDGTQQCAAAGV